MHVACVLPRAAADIAGLEELPADELWTSMWGPEEQRRIGAVAASLLEKVIWSPFPA